MQRDVLPVDRSNEDRDGRRPRFPAWARLTGAVLIALHLTTVYWLAVRSLSGPYLAPGSAIPLHTIRTYLALGPAGAVWHLAAALLLLAPLGVLLPLVAGRADVSVPGSFARTAFAGLMLSFGAQVVRTGFAGQIFDVDVVFLNTAGVALAHLLVVPAARAVLRRRGSTGDEPAGPPAVDADQAAGTALPTVGATP